MIQNRDPMHARIKHRIKQQQQLTSNHTRRTQIAHAPMHARNSPYKEKQQHQHHSLILTGTRVRACYNHASS